MLKRAVFLFPGFTGCPAFSVANGEVVFRSASFVDSSTGSLLYVSGDAQITCEEGLRLEPNNPVLTCQNNGTWTGSVPNCTARKSAKYTKSQHSNQ